jgi:hypothetical protein
MFKKIKHKIAMWLWKGNDWTVAVDDIHRAAKQLQASEYEEVILRWHFSFMPEPNKFTCVVRRTTKVA